MNKQPQWVTVIMVTVLATVGRTRQPETMQGFTAPVQQQRRGGRPPPVFARRLNAGRRMKEWATGQPLASCYYVHVHREIKYFHLELSNWWSNKPSPQDTKPIFNVWYHRQAQSKLLHKYWYVTGVLKAFDWWTGQIQWWSCSENSRIGVNLVQFPGISF